MRHRNNLKRSSRDANSSTGKRKSAPSSFRENKDKRNSSPKKEFKKSRPGKFSSSERADNTEPREKRNAASFGDEKRGSFKKGFSKKRPDKFSSRRDSDPGKPAYGSKRASSFQDDTEKRSSFKRGPKRERTDKFSSKDDASDSRKPTNRSRRTSSFQDDTEKRSSIKRGPKRERPDKFSSKDDTRETPRRRTPPSSFQSDSRDSFKKGFKRTDRFSSKGDSPEAGTERRVAAPKEEVDNRSFFNKGAKRDRKSTSAESDVPETPTTIRLNKYISNSGVCSRREADNLISMGLISVNGKVITELGYKVNPGDVVRHESKVLTAEKPVYVLMNKPKGYLTTTKDPEDRNTVMAIIGDAVKERIYPVGRLDRNTTGLLLLTNDGDLADKLMHPSYNVKKIYKVELDKPLDKADLHKIQEGVRLEEGRATVDDVAIVSDNGKTVGIELHIGWNRVVRRIFETLGYDVIKLDRVVYAGLDKKELPRGHWRFLKKGEIVKLKHFK